MAAKKPINKIPRICHNKNNPTKFKMAAKKPSPDIIVTWKVTIPL